MKRLANEKDEELENRKTKRMVRVYFGISIISISLGIVAYTVGTILNYHNKYVRYDIDNQKQEELFDEVPVLKKVL